MLYHVIYILNTILQYQYAGNAQVVYSLIRNREKITALSQLDYERAIEEAKNVAARRQPQSEASVSPSISEKAQGKLPASPEYKSSSGFVPSPEWVTSYNLV